MYICAGRLICKLYLIYIKSLLVRCRNMPVYLLFSNCPHSHEVISSCVGQRSYSERRGVKSPQITVITTSVVTCHTPCANRNNCVKGKILVPCFLPAHLAKDKAVRFISLKKAPPLPAKGKMSLFTKW